jgi:hypothetical protein
VLSRRSFLRSATAFGAVAATKLVRSMLARAATTWVSPPSIDNTGGQNVSAALTEWLATTGHPGDIFRLRRGPRYAPGLYRIPQGVRIGKPMTLDLRGCWLCTGTDDGSQHAPLWNDWGEQDAGDGWYRKRVCLNVASSDVTIQSSLVHARIQGSGRRATLRSGDIDLPSGVAYDPTVEGQHAIRIGREVDGMPQPISNVRLDLTDIALEFVHGDGVGFMRGVSDVTIHGRNLGEGVVGGQPAARDPDYLGAVGGLGAWLDDAGYWHPQIAVYPGIHHVGRQGIGVGFDITNLLVDGISIWRTGRSAIDLEPAGSDSVVNGVAIRNTETGIHHLRWLAAAARSCNDVTVTNNVCYEPITITTEPTDSGSPLRHRNWRLLGNRGGLRQRVGAVFDLSRIDGLEVRDNLQRVDTGARGVDLESSTGVVISPAETVQFPVFGTPVPA